MGFEDKFSSSDDNFSEEEGKVLGLFCKCRDKEITPCDALAELTKLIEQESEVMESAKV